MDNKVFFRMDTVQFGSIRGYIREDDPFPYRHAVDTNNVLTDIANDLYKESARWIVRKSGAHYEIEDMINGNKIDISSEEAVASFFRGVFYQQS